MRLPAPSTRNQTVRVQIVNANALKDKKDAILRFMQAYRETIDWMYASPDAVKLRADANRSVAAPLNMVPVDTVPTGSADMNQSVAQTNGELEKQRAQPPAPRPP